MSLRQHATISNLGGGAVSRVDVLNDALIMNSTSVMKGLLFLAPYVRKDGVSSRYCLGRDEVAELSAVGVQQPHGTKISCPLEQDMSQVFVLSNYEFTHWQEDRHQCPRYSTSGL